MLLGSRTHLPSAMVRTPGQKVKHSKQGNKKSLAEVIEGSAAVLHMKDSMEEKKEEEEELVMDISFEFPFGEQPEVGVT